jgi:hypothetical protein
MWNIEVDLWGLLNAKEERPFIGWYGTMGRGTKTANEGQ